MNSSSKNSKFKNLDELKARMAAKNNAGGGFGAAQGGSGFGGGGFGPKIQKRQEVIIEEVEEVRQLGKMYDFDMNQVDASLLPPKDNTKPIMVGVIVLVSLLFGSVIGWCWQGVLADRSDVNSRIEVAKSVDEVVRPKIDAFQTFVQIFKQKSESLGAGVLEYNPDFFENVIKKYNSPGFVLDISKDLPANTIVMASNAAQNPLSDIRGYAAGTTLLSELLESHIKQTNDDMAEINALLGKSSATDRNIVYALKVNDKNLLTMVTPQSVAEKGYNRLAEAITCTEVYQVKSAITDDVEAAKVFAELIAAGKVAPEDVERRTYVPDPAEKRGKKSAKQAPETVEITTDPDLKLPSRLMYVIEDRNGKRQTVFADEIILIERSKLFAGSANALERYKKRMVQLLAILGEVEKTTDGLSSRLHIISTEEPL